MEVEDDAAGAIWSASEAIWGGDGEKMAEWDAEAHVRKRWVGPMMWVTSLSALIGLLMGFRVLAQLHPADRPSAHPQGANPYGELEGENVDLGPKGMYTSLGFEDLDAVMGWVELKGGGAHVADARRSGLGFE